MNLQEFIKTNHPHYEKVDTERLNNLQRWMLNDMTTDEKKRLRLWRVHYSDVFNEWLQIVDLLFEDCI